MTIIRSGEPFTEGFDCRESIISVFSCSDYGGNNNKSALIHVLKNGELLPKILNVSGGKDRWLNIEDTGSKKNLNNEESALRKLNFTPPKKTS